MADICTFGLDGIYTFNWECVLFSGKWFNIVNQMACFTGYIHLCRHLLVVCFRHLANFNQCDFWNVLKKILFVTKFHAVNLYSRTPLTRVGLLQFPLDLTKKFQSWLEESPLIINYCLQGERLYELLILLGSNHLLWKTVLLCSS